MYWIDSNMDYSITNRQLMAMAALLLFAHSLPASELEVIYDSGSTFPIHAKSHQIEQQAQASQAKFAQPIPISYPIETPSLKVGYEPRRTMQLPWITQPVFLIGTDDRSQVWLRERRKQLMDLQAIGMIIQAHSENEVEAMRKIAEGIPLQVASAESLVEQLALTHYPVLISKFGIEQ